MFESLSKRKIKEKIKYKGAKGIPAMKASGNSIAKNTGSWRTFKPKIDLKKCIRCRLCWLNCPESAISLDKKSYPKIDYRTCKGCMICLENCPVKAISKRRDLHEKD